MRETLGQYSQPDGEARDFRVFGIRWNVEGKVCYIPVSADCYKDITSLRHPR